MERAAGFIIFRKMPEIQFLLMQTSYGKHHWSPPKGHVDPGETDIQTAFRETEEEAGFKEKMLRIIPEFKVELNYPVKSHKDGIVRQKTTIYWLAELINPRVDQVQMSHEHQDFKWLPFHEAIKLTEAYEDFNLELKNCLAKIEESG